MNNYIIFLLLVPLSLNMISESRGDNWFIFLISKTKERFTKTHVRSSILSAQFLKIFSLV